MTASALLTDESSSKASMWAGFRCNKALLVLFLINVIVLQSIICECLSSNCAILANIAVHSGQFVAHTRAYASLRKSFSKAAQPLTRSMRFSGRFETELHHEFLRSRYAGS